MTKTNDPDPPQVECGNPVPASKPWATEPPLHARNSNKVYKSGPLFLSSKGIGWTSWKKRWFILTSTSLVFFRSDPNAVLPKGCEVNCTLGGIDLNSSGSVVVKEDKKLITVQFPDGRDGRTFTLKAETLEGLNEWKAALQEALANAPNNALPVTQNGISKNDQAKGDDASVDQYCEVNFAKDSKPEKSIVIGRPVLLALENTDGTPSFLEKALRFVEQHGVKVEGILRQAADVEDVERRIMEYEQGKNEFSPEEDAHVIADCVKYVLRELSSSPIPASCCKALVEAGRTERSKRLAAIQNAIYETFPEPNCRLLQRILMMMQTIAANKTQNRMSISAVAACMAPLLLRPLLAGECELDQKLDVGGDGSVQLLQAAAAANNAQSICITLLEEYDNLFREGTMAPDLYTETEESGSESEELTDEGETSEDYSDDDDGTDGDMEQDYQHTSRGSRREARETEGCDHSNGSSHSDSQSEEFHDTCEPNNKQVPAVTSNNINQGGTQSKDQIDNNLNKTRDHVKKSAASEHTGRKKKLSMGSKDLPFEEEGNTLRPEESQADFHSKLAEQAKGNAHLVESLERRKNALLDCRIALEKDVSMLREQLLKESELTTALEAGLRGSQGPKQISAPIDEKTMEILGEIAQVELDINNLKQNADDLRSQLDQKREQNFRLQHMKVTQKEFDLSSAINFTEKLQISKHQSLMDRAEHGKEKKQPLTSSSCKHSTQRQLSETGLSTPVLINSRKSGARGEGTNVLSKLTNRLHFLKERKSQIANELQNMEKDRNTAQPVSPRVSGASESRKSFQRNEKSQGSEGRSAERGKAVESVYCPDNGGSEATPSLERGNLESHQT